MHDNRLHRCAHRVHQVRHGPNARPAYGSTQDATARRLQSLDVDGVLTSVGSTNFDSRSFRLNDEANRDMLNADFGRLQHEVFNSD